MVGCAVARALAGSVDTLLLVGKPSFQFISIHFNAFLSKNRMDMK